MRAYEKRPAVSHGALKHYCLLSAIQLLVIAVATIAVAVAITVAVKQLLQVITILLKQ